MSSLLNEKFADAITAKDDNKRREIIRDLNWEERGNWRESFRKHPIAKMSPANYIATALSPLLIPTLTPIWILGFVLSVPLSVWIWTRAQHVEEIFYEVWGR